MRSSQASVNTQQGQIARTDTFIKIKKSIWTIYR
jgi:hypothetical protein